MISTLRDLPGICEINIIQESQERTCVQIVKEEGFLQELETLIMNKFKKRLGEEVRTEFEYLNEISKEYMGSTDMWLVT